MTKVKSPERLVLFKSLRERKYGKSKVKANIRYMDYWQLFLTIYITIKIGWLYNS